MPYAYACHIYYMCVFREGSSFRLMPQLGTRCVVDSKSWNANGTTNLRTVRQMLKGAEPAGF